MKPQEVNLRYKCVTRQFLRDGGKIVKTLPTGRASEATLGGSSVLRCLGRAMCAVAEDCGARQLRQLLFPVMPGLSYPSAQTLHLTNQLQLQLKASRLGCLFSVTARTQY